MSELEPPNPAGQRVEDIPLLVGYFAQKYGPRLGKRIPSVLPATLEVLADYQWPGNVRELENVVERALILNEGPHLDLGAWFFHGPRAPLAREREHILAVLEGTGWRVSGEGGAAGLLRMKPTTLEARMRELGITRPSETSEVFVTGPRQFRPDR